SVHGAGGAEGSDCGEDGDQEGDDAHRDLESLLGAFDERLVDLDALEPSVERDSHQDPGEGPVGAALEELAERHRTTRSSSMAETAGWPSGTSRNSGRKMGRAARASLSTSPDFSAILSRPNHSDMTPMSPIASVTALPAPSSAPVPTAFTSPRTAAATSAATRSRTKTTFIAQRHGTRTRRRQFVCRFAVIRQRKRP